MGEHLCATCEFHCDYATGSFSDKPTGECRKYAPDAAYGWPKAPSDGWCGEWEKRIDTSTDDDHKDWPRIY